MGQTQSGQSSRSQKLPSQKQDEEAFQQNASHRRKWPNRFGTIRKKLVRTLKGTKHVDYRKQMREILQSWKTNDICSLVDHYESSQAWRDVVSLSNSARPAGRTLVDDMNQLYEEEYLSDIILEYKGTYFPVHRVILSCRCPYFAGMFHAMNEDQLREPVAMTDEIEDITKDEFSALLKYLYTGNDCLTSSFDEQVLSRVIKTFAVPNELETDLKVLMTDEMSMDLELVFPSCPAKEMTENAIENKGELVLSCHSAMLSARSPYFRSLLQKLRSKNQPRSSPVDRKTRLVVDETILPRQYAVVVLKCVYQTCIDLQSVIKWKTSEELLFETDKLLTTSEIAMELYEIGRFLDFTSLTEGCENIIFDDLSHFSLLSILDWSSEPFGSPWIKRQAFQFLLDNFTSTAKSSSLLASIPKEFLIGILRSDFLQASEEDVLSAVIKWGEWQAAKVLDRQVTTLLSSSLTRRSPKRRDVSNESLQAAVSDLLPLVRVKHILPANSLVLQHAYQRRLFEKPFPLDVCAGDVVNTDGLPWMKHKGRRDFVPPRLFIPYCNEAKLLLSERLLGDVENVLHGKDHQVNSIPDMLSQITTKQLNSPQVTGGCPSAPLPTNILEKPIIQQIASVEEELLSSKVYQRALKLCPEKTIAFQVRQHAMRQIGLPDELAHEIVSSVPDVVEDSSSSSSSKHSTLSKIGFLMNDVVAPDVTLSAAEQLQD